MSRENHNIQELIEPRHHRAEIVFGLVAFLVALGLATKLESQLTWKAGQAFVRQPGFFTSIAIAGMLLCGTFELYFAWKRNASGRGSSIGSEIFIWFSSIEYAMWFFGYVLLVARLGYLPATLIFCATLTLRLGYRGKLFMGSALLFGFATVVIFKSLLSVKIPGAVAYEYLPEAIRNFMILYF